MHFVDLSKIFAKLFNEILDFLKFLKNLMAISQHP